MLSGLEFWAVICLGDGGASEELVQFLWTLCCHLSRFSSAFWWPFSGLWFLVSTVCWATDFLVAVHLLPGGCSSLKSPVNSELILFNS